MAKLTLTEIQSLTNEQSAITALNANYSLIEDALENTLSLDGTSPNSMDDDLDMDDNKILNVATPTSNSDAANKEYVDNAVTGEGAGDIASSVAAAAASAAAALASQTAAEDAQVAAETAETNAETAETNAETAETNAAASAASAAATITADNNLNSIKLANLATTGLVVRRQSHTTDGFGTVTLTGEANKIVIADGDGLGTPPAIANPTFTVGTKVVTTDGDYTMESGKSLGYTPTKCTAHDPIQSGDTLVFTDGNVQYATTSAGGTFSLVGPQTGYGQMLVLLKSGGTMSTGYPKITAGAANTNCKEITGTGTTNSGEHNLIYIWRTSNGTNNYLHFQRIAGSAT